MGKDLFPEENIRLLLAVVKELDDHGIKTNANELLEVVTELKMAETFFGCIENLAPKVEERCRLM